MSRANKPVPDVLIEQLALGEISAEDERFLRSELPPEELARRLSALRVEDERFLARGDADRQVTAIEAGLRIEKARRAASESKRQAARYWLPGLAAAVCASLWLAQPPSSHVDTQVAANDGVRLKGFDSHLVLYRRVGDKADALAEGARTKTGDMLQIGYVAAKAAHGVILSLDGAGTVTLHYPENELGSTKLETQGEQLLEFAYELDDAPHFERFFFVTSATAIDVHTLLQTARNLARTPHKAERASLPIALNLSQTSLTLVKE